MTSNVKRILLRAFLFANAGIVGGAVIGIINGVSAGAVLGFLMSGGLQTASAGGMVGGMIGIRVGMVTCALGWLIAGAVQWKCERPWRILWHTIRGTTRASLLMTFAGATSGVLFHSAWLYATKNANNAVQMALEPFSGGFFWGSIAGCAFGLFFGAIFGARPAPHWLNVPLREIPGEFKGELLRLFPIH